MQDSARPFTANQRAPYVTISMDMSMRMLVRRKLHGVLPMRSAT